MTPERKRLYRESLRLARSLRCRGRRAKPPRRVIRLHGEGYATMRHRGIVAAFKSWSVTLG